MKVTFLVNVTLARRVSKISALSVTKELYIFKEDRIIMRLDPTFLSKVNSSFHSAEEVVLPSFYPNPRHPRERD